MSERRRGESGGSRMQAEGGQKAQEQEGSRNPRGRERRRARRREWEGERERDNPTVRGHGEEIEQRGERDE